MICADSFSSHLDAIRAILSHPSEHCLVTGRDDMTAKIWHVDVAGLASSAASMHALLGKASATLDDSLMPWSGLQVVPNTKIELQLVLRGHSTWCMCPGSSYSSWPHWTHPSKYGCCLRRHT